MNNLNYIELQVYDEEQIKRMIQDAYNAGKLEGREEGYLKGYDAGVEFGKFIS